MDCWSLSKPRSKHSKPPKSMPPRTHMLSRTPSQLGHVCPWAAPFNAPVASESSIANAAPGTWSLDSGGRPKQKRISRFVPRPSDSKKHRQPGLVTSFRGRRCGDAFEQVTRRLIPCTHEPQQEVGRFGRQTSERMTRSGQSPSRRLPDEKAERQGISIPT